MGAWPSAAHGNATDGTARSVRSREIPATRRPSWRATQATLCVSGPVGGEGTTYPDPRAGRLEPGWLIDSQRVFNT